MVKFVEASWLQDHLSDPSLVIVDPRPVVKYLGGHIPHAVNLPMSKLLDPKTMALLPPDQLSKIFGENGIDAKSTAVLYDDYDGQNAAMLAWSLKYLGLAVVALLTPRLGSWTEGGGELLYKPVSKSPKKFVANPNTNLRSLAEEILYNRDAKILDLRSREEFQGKVATETRTGHIPGAINIPWTELLGKEEFLRPVNELEKVFERIGVSPNDRIVTYCTYGPRAAIGFLALQRLDYRKVSVYDGSFHQWAQRSELPVEGEGLQLEL